MTWDQFIGAALGLALIALGRLLDKYLPPTEDHGVTAAGGGSTMPPEAQ